MQPKPEKLWHIELAVIIAIILQIVLASRFSFGPKYLIACLELSLLVGLHWSTSVGQDSASRHRRWIGLALTALVSATNVASLVIICHTLFTGGTGGDGKQLLISGVSIYLTNIILFGLWYWQLDGGGPGGRGTHRPPVDYLFPQMNTPDHVTQDPNWRPLFFDYMYLSITNATAFSPTDTLPLTHRAKLLMSIQALASLATIALVAARAVNILG